MAKWKVYTPDGVQDILFEECYIKREIENKARMLFRRRGYKEIETPSIEFYDVYSARQKILSQETMFKFCDKDGRILALRPDLTVPAVRVATSKLKDMNKPIALFYIGNTFRYNESGGGKQKEYTQAGAEIIGAEGSQPDAQIIATAISLLLESGLENFKIDIGQVEFFKGIIEQLNIKEEDAEELRELIDNKDYIALEKMAENKNMPEDIKELIIKLPGLFGSKDIIDELERSNVNERSKKALKNLKEILEIIEDYGYGEYVSVDLGMLPGLDYYTGIIFRGFTYGIGFPVCSGGRYDTLAETFGEKAPATGFSMGVNLLITAMRRQKIKSPEPQADYFISYGENQRKNAFLKANELMEDGKNVLIDIQGHQLDSGLEYALQAGYRNYIFISEGGKINEFDLAVFKNTSYEGGGL